jgi:uracil-DNA glycosylase family 4
MNDDLRNELAMLRELGYTHFEVGAAPAVEQMVAAKASPTRIAEKVAERAPAPAPPRVVAPPQVEPSGERGAPSTNEILDPVVLEELARIAARCTRCRLSASRTQVVFGTGNPEANLMFVGEAPGRDEDLQGEPFVGKAGQLLTDIIKAMKLSRADVYIANVIKCRPPENRNPEPDELDSCRPYIKRQVELIRPKVIVTLGKFALQSLTGKTYSISSIRGEWLEHEGVKVMPTFHPAYLLRTPSAKKDVWQDMKKVMTELGIVF